MMILSPDLGNPHASMLMREVSLFSAFMDGF